MRITETAEATRIDASGYSALLFTDRPVVRLLDATGARWVDLALVAGIDTAQGLDTTAAIRRGPVGVDGESWRIEFEGAGGRWDRKVVQLSGDDAIVRWAVRVDGTGDPTDVRLLGGAYSADRRLGTGEYLSAHAFATVFNPEPSDPARVCRSAREPAQIDVTGGGRGPASGHWFFTPPPFAFAFSRSEIVRDPAPASTPDGPWLTIGLEAPVSAQTFTAFRYEPDERAFSLVLRYEGQTHVSGRFEPPAVAFHFGASGAYEGITRYSDAVRRAALAAAAATAAPPFATAERRRPGWWREPIFCGWGAQFRVHTRLGIPPQYAANQSHYDQWLERLAEHGLVPGTIVIDDKWQGQYGTNEPDLERWPDLAAWVAARHEAGQRVLLWWKAWDPEGLPAEICVTNSEGAPIATDPTNPTYEALLRASVRRMVSPPPRGLGADGFKVDFTALTPSGPGLRRYGAEWGVALLHRLLEILTDETRRMKPDALIVTHTPNPAFADVADMIRLNDMDRFDEPDDPVAIVPQMLHRWRIARAACPDLLVDTDDWGAPSLEVWRKYQALKLGLGVPALYYVDGLDRSPEDFEPSDYAMLRRLWAEARAKARREGWTKVGRAVDPAGDHAADPAASPSVESTVDPAEVTTS